MAYSKSPTVSTYETKRVDFVINPIQRSGSLLNKDAKLVNMMVEVVETPNNTNQRIFVKSRPGLALAYTTVAGVGRGCYYWVVSGVGYVISVVGSSVYSNGTFLQTITTSTGPCGFTEHVSSTGTATLVMLDGTKGYVFTTPTTAGTAIDDTAEAVWTTVTSIALNARRRPTAANGYIYTATVAGTTAVAQPTWPTTVGATVVDGTVTWTCGICNFPTPHIPMPVFLDGYLFVAKANTQDIYNSDLDQPTLWTPGDFISAEMYPDKIIALSKNNNYVYAVGSNSVEYFYDAGVASGSPLARHDSAVQQFGTAAPATVVQTEKEVIMVGETGNGGHTIWTIDGFKENEVGTPAIRGILRAEGANLVNAAAHCTRVSGHKLYIINLTTNTLVYDFDTKMWSYWNSGATGALAFVGKWGTDGPNGMAYIQHATDGDIYTISEDYHTDHGDTFMCQIITPKYDFDTFNAKFMSRFTLIGDVPTTSGVGNTLQVSWSDDDYKTWITDRDLSFDNDFPCIAQLGRFRRRAFRVNYSQPYLLRLEAFEVDINKGNQ
jgi:hypothetical protein